MSKLSDSVLEVFAAFPKAAANVATQIEVGRVGRSLKANEFPWANGSEANLVPSDQETPQPQAHSDHSDQFPTKNASERISPEKHGTSGFGDTYTLVREIWALPGERAFQLDARSRARTRLVDACPTGIDPVRWRQAIEAAGALMAKVKGGAGPVITFREVADAQARTRRLASMGDAAIPEERDQALSSESAAPQNTRTPDAVEGA
jgi:hypothetical protein